MASFPFWSSRLLLVGITFAATIYLFYIARERSFVERFMIRVENVSDGVQRTVTVMNVTEVDWSLFNETLVNGWYPNVSRSLGDYLSRDRSSTMLIRPRKICANATLLTAFVVTAPGNFDAREMVRNTWALQKSGNLNVYFMLGTTDNVTIQEAMVLENEHADDMIQERFVDSYNNLTLKSAAMVKVFHDHCQNSKYLLKVDDDVYASLFTLLRDLVLLRDERLITGQLLSGMGPIRDGNHKWYMPRYLFENATYPDYICGASYLLSKSATDGIYVEMWRTPLVHMEDIFVTGLCALKVDVARTHNDRFVCSTSQRVDCDVYTIHCGVDNMHKYWLEWHEKCAKG